MRKFIAQACPAANRPDSLGHPPIRSAMSPNPSHLMAPAAKSGQIALKAACHPSVAITAGR